MLGDCLAVKPTEEVLVVANPATVGLGEALRRAAADMGAEAVLAVITERDSHAGEPPAPGPEKMVARGPLLPPAAQAMGILVLGSKNERVAFINH